MFRLSRVSRCSGQANDHIRVCCGWLPARWILGIMGFFGTMNVYSLRINLSAAIVGMVDYEGLKNLHTDKGNSSIEVQSLNFNASAVHVEQCRQFESEKNQGSINATGKLFLWDENTQGLALASYFYGYVCAQVLGTWVARKLGRVRVWGISLLIASLCTILLPTMLEIGFGAFAAVRFIIGLFSGVSYPIMHGMWSAWAPPEERGKLMALQFSGASVGSFIVFPLSGFLTKEYGWPCVFYVTGAAGTIWSICWWILIHDSPAEHPRISDAEKQYIESSLGHNKSAKESKEQQQRAVPWFALMTSIRVWSTIIPHFASNFSTFIFLTMLPTYLRTMLNFDVKSSGALSSIPYIMKLVLFFVAGWSADFAISKGVRLIIVRKIWSSLGLLLPGVALALAGYTGCNVPLIMFLFTIPISMDTFTIPGFKTSMIEIAPAFAGIIFALANTIATTAGFLAPQIAGALREAHRDDQIQGWRSLFWLGAVAYIIGGLVFLIFGSSDAQKWAQLTGSDHFVGENECLVEEKKPDEGDAKSV